MVSIFTFGRFNPPTNGHQLLFKTIMKEAIKNKCDHAFVFTSQTNDTERNLLTYSDKLFYLDEILCQYNLTLDTQYSIKTPFTALEHLSTTNDELYFVIGSDRIDLANSMKQYSERVLGTKFTTILAPERNDINTYSATMLRHAVRTDNKELYYECVASKLSKASQSKMYRILSELMNI